MTDTTTPTVTNVVLAGLGGQGVLKASDILAEAAFLAGLDVKKAEVHGMSQRGGSVASDIRFGSKVFSPMVPPGEADFLLVLASDQMETNRHVLREGGVAISPDLLDGVELPNRRALNVALLGVLSRRLPLAMEVWRQAIADNFDPKFHEANLQAFDLGRSSCPG